MINPEINYNQLPHKQILCVDMKAFYASIEAVDRGYDPLAIHLAVVGDKQRQGSVILAASPALKQDYHLKTGNRLYEIPDIPEILVVEARMGLYVRVSLAITRFFNEFVPLEAIQVYSIDEAWIKLDGTERRLGDSRQAALKIKQGLKKRFGLDCSMGLGPNMFLAKVAMDIEGKQKGLACWGYEDVPEKLWPVPLVDCWGIGSRLARRFYRIGVKTVGDLAYLPLDYLEKRLGIMGNQLYYHAWGVDLSRVTGHYLDRPENLGRGITLLRDYRDAEEVKTVIFDLAEEVGQRARARELSGKTVSLSLGYSREELEGGFNRQRTLDRYTNLTRDIYQTCLELFRENYGGQVVRRVAVTLGNFSEQGVIQMKLFDSDTRRIELHEVKDRLQKRFGYKALFYGRSLKSGSVRERIKTTIGGHKT
ncbi:MAG: DNA polymerase thumb domain-containing protein [Bacillota bacterium]